MSLSNMISTRYRKSARYTCAITGDQDHFVATAIARRLDDDPAIDKWQIDETGELRVVIDDSIDR